MMITMKRANQGESDEGMGQVMCIASHVGSTCELKSLVLGAMVDYIS